MTTGNPLQRGFIRLHYFQKAALWSRLIPSLDVSLARGTLPVLDVQRVPFSTDVKRRSFESCVPST